MKYIFTISKQPDHHGIRILAADVCDYLILSVRVPAYNGASSIMIHSGSTKALQ